MSFSTTILKFFLSLILLLSSVFAQAQCSVCTKTTADLSPEAASGLNLGIVYLAMLPMTIIFVIGFIWYKKSKANF